MSSGVWLIIVGLVAINALYVAAELAAVGVRRSQLRGLAERGSVQAQRLLAILDDPQRLDRYIATSQVGITLGNTILGAYTDAQLTPWLVEQVSWLGPATARIAVLVVVSIVLIVLGELVPKTVALQSPVRVALVCGRPMAISRLLFTPFVIALNRGTWAVLRLLGLPTSRHHHVHSPEEIDLLLVESRDGGLLEADEQERLHRALQLSRLTARQLMVPRLYLDMVDLDDRPEEIVEAVLATAHTRLPAYRQSPDNVLGLLHSRDVVLRLTAAGDLGSPDSLLRQIPAVSEHVSGERLLMLLREHGTEMALVIDEYGGMAGLVSVQDILTEVLEDIHDSSSAAQPKPERLADGRLRLPGLLRPDETQEWIGVQWAGEAETLGGRVAELLGRLPEAGAEVVIDGVILTVERVERRAVMSVLATPPVREEEGADDV